MNKHTKTNNKESIKNQIDAYLAQFTDEGAEIPTRQGYMTHMNINGNQLKYEAPNSYELRLGLMHVEMYLEKALRGPQSPKLSKIMIELSNGFGWVS